MTKEVSEGTGRLFYVFKTVVFCFVLTFVLILLCAVVAVYVAASDSVIALMTAFSSCVSVTVGGFSVSKHTGSRGLLYGSLLGAVYVVLLYLTGCIAFGRLSFGIAGILSGVIGIGCGALGGVMGVNSKSVRKKR